jgi:GGDEF domain-containing protein
MAVGINDYESIPPVRLPGVLRTLSLVFRHYIRPVDILGKHVTEGVFLIVLPHMSLKEGTSLALRMSREVEAFGFTPFDDDRQLRVSVGLVPFTEEVASAELLIEEALQALQGQMQADLHEIESNQ